MAILMRTRTSFVALVFLLAWQLVGCRSEEVASVILGQETSSAEACSDGVISGGGSIDGPDELAEFAELIDQGCTILEGSLRISDSTGTMTSLEPLYGLEWISGDLMISDAPNLTTLAGIDRVTHVNNLWLDNLPSLVSLAPLAALEEIDGRLWIRDVDSITTLEGLGGLRWIRPDYVNDGILRISSNDVLTSVDTLAAVKIELAYTHFEASITLNPELPTCNAVETLASMNLTNETVVGNKEDECS